MSRRHTTPSAASLRNGLAALFLGICGFSLVAFSAHAQQACEIVLMATERSYQDGRLAEVFAVKEACIRGKATRDQKVQAHALLAKVYVALDKLERARQNIRALLTYNSEFEPDRRDPVRYVQLVEEAKIGEAVVTVASVSKSDEPLREAPATVVIVTAEQIRRRGYLDLEALLHDLPGLDISTANGDLYSNVYQRGLRSNGTTRTLLLVDGVEENNLFGNIANISRQYSISDIERVEVIYGPASTMYGANAFAGVIHVITKQPAEIVEEDKRLGGRMEQTAGSFGTVSLETMLAGKARSAPLSWSLTGRIFRSDEMDLSSYENWDYNPAALFSPAFQQRYKELLRLEGDDRAEFLGFLEAFPIFACPPQGDQEDCLYEITDSTVELTTAGAQRAAELDQAFLLHGGVDGGPIRFTDDTDDWLVRGRLRVANLELGFQSWSRREGQVGDLTDLVSAGSDEGSVETHEKESYHVKYSRSLSNNVNLNLFSFYKISTTSSSSAEMLGYIAGDATIPYLLLGVSPFVLTKRSFLTARQLRAELSLTYKPSSRLSLVSGVELRDSSVPALPLQTCPGPLGPESDFESCKLDPRQTGVPSRQIPGGNQIHSQDLGVYAQVTYKPWKELKVVVGGRLDNNDSQPFEGYGTVFNPRLAVIYPLRTLVIKAIYAEAFKAPSNLEKYTRTVPTPDLEEEKVKNLELSANWQPRDDLYFNLAAYDSNYSNLVELRRFPCEQIDISLCDSPIVNKNVNTGLLRIRGVQADFALGYENLDIHGNYTYIQPYNIDPADPDDPAGGPLMDPQGNPIHKLRIGDMASHQVTIGLNAVFRRRITVNLRSKYVDAKPTGQGTTVFSNRLSKIDSYFVTNATLTWRDALPHTDLALIVNNVFDEEYFHPGTATADGYFLASQIPQRRRAVYLRGSIHF
ncbi:MAG: TonB-dependent receptor [bacterium]|nr:TonB-dependent receptor [bacterium]